MKKIGIFLSLFLTLCLGFTFSAKAGEVAQGKCIAYDASKRTITLDEYDTNFSESRYGKSTGVISTFDCTTAKIGIQPQPGDILRIAYVLDGGAKKAAKVMNVSKQDLRKK